MSKKNNTNVSLKDDNIKKFFYNMPKKLQNEWLFQMIGKNTYKFYYFGSKYDIFILYISVIKDTLIIKYVVFKKDDKVIWNLSCNCRQITDFFINAFKSHAKRCNIKFKIL